MFRQLPVMTAFLVVLGSGLAHGLWTSRWHTSEELESAVAAVERVPLVIGDWQGKPLTVDEEPFVQAGALGHWTRQYQTRGASYTVILMCGDARRMAVHTPDVCYRGAGFEMSGAQSKLSLPHGVEFWATSFHKDQAAGPIQLRVYWAWKFAGDWQAPTQSRIAFGGATFLYKLYVVRESSVGEREDPTEGFLRDLVPALNSVLYSPRVTAKGEL